MAISIVAKTRAFATLQTNITLALPAGVQNGDVLVAVLTHQNNANVWTLPDGTWSRIGNAYVANDADYRGDIIAAHVVTNAGAEPSTFTYSYAGGNGRVTGTLIVFRGVDTAVIDDGHPAAKALTTTGNVRTMPSFTVGHDNSYLLWLANNNLISPNAAGVTLTGTDTQLDFLNSIGDTDNTTVTRTLLAVYGRQLGAAGASPTPSVTWPAVSGANIMAVALKAAVVAGNTAPVANFSYSANDTVLAFTDTSTDSDGTIASRSWTFGDGTTSTATNPTKTYAKAGTYSVSLTVMDNGGATNTKTQSITVTGVTAYIWNGTVYREAHLKKDLNGAATAVASLTGEFGVRPNWNQVLAKTTPIFGAHRGFSGNYPEMTLRAYNAATILWKDKVDFLEVSVQFDSQGVAWGLHDSTVNRTAGGPTGALSTFTTAQVAAMNVYPSGTDNQIAPPAPMYKLTDMLARFGGKVPIIIEDKTYTHTTQILDLMDANGGPNWYMWKQSGNGTLFPAVTARGYKSWGYYFDGSDMTVFPNNHTQWTFVGIDFNSSDATLTSAVATAGNWTDGRSRVIGHIVGNATQRDRMLGMGMRGLMVSSGRLVLPRF